MAAFDQAIVQNPQDARAYLGRAGCKLKLGDKEGAAADFGKAFQLEPQLAQEAVNPPPDLLAKFNQAIAQDPQNRKTYIDRGWARAKRGDAKGAIEDFTKAIELDPRVAATYLSRGIALADMGDTQHAIADFGKAIELEPKNADGYSYRATVRAIRKEWAAAIADFRKALELDPKLQAELEPLLSQCITEQTAAEQKPAKP